MFSGRISFRIDGNGRPSDSQGAHGNARCRYIIPLAPQRKKTVARDNNLELLRLCKKYDVPTILGSDAHISLQIADYEYLYPLLAETDFPDDLIMNYWPDKFFDYLGIQRHCN